MNQERNLADIIISNKDLDKKGFVSSIRFAILRNITIDPILPCITNVFGYEKIAVEIFMGDFDVVLPEFISTDSKLKEFKPDVIALHLNLSILSPKLIYEFSSLSQSEINSCKEDVLGFINKILEESESTFSSSILVFHSFETPLYPTFGILDSKYLNKQSNTVSELNTLMRLAAENYNNVHFVDNNRIRSILGENEYYDKRYWSIGKAPYGFGSLLQFSTEYLKIIRAKLGKNSKCLVLDCDNTLWKGIIGEDGIENIGLGNTYPGNTFIDFQKAILDLSNRGVILAIASKNNHEDVIEVLNNHPDMILREDNFAIIKANWQDKPSNIRQISDDLNIGIDSLVFVDDNKFETEMVEKMLPEVKVIHLPKDSSKYRDLILSCGYFDSLSYSDEDKNRGKMYKADSKRKTLKSEINSMNEYFKSLEMELTINKVDKFSIPRVSQLTQRTNQFNLTTKRYSENDIKKISDSENSDVLYTELSDKFGNLGIIGVSIIFYEKSFATIDTFLLSCRVIGRGIEDNLLLETLKLANKRKLETIKSNYVRTLKNDQVSDFFDKRNFVLTSNSDERKEYNITSGVNFKVPDYFKEIKILYDN